MLIDLHNHTSALSLDSVISPEDLVEEAKRAGLDGICITEHDYFWDHDSIVRLGKWMDFLVIPGVEINTEEGHLLVFGLKEYVFGMHRARFVKEWVDRNGGAMLLAHPYRRRFRPEYDGQADYEQMLNRACNNAVFALIDGVEVNNGRGSEKENAFANDLAERLRLKGVATSDAHQLHDIGKNATRFDDKITGVEDLVMAIKAGRFWPEPLR